MTTDKTVEARLARLKELSMRDHVFEGDGLYCDHHHTSTPSYLGFTFTSQCGWTREYHPKETK